MGRVALGFLLVLLLSVVPATAEADASTAQRLVSFEGVPPPAGSPLGEARVLEAFPFARVALVEGPAASLARLASIPGIAKVSEVETLTPALDRARAIAHAEGVGVDPSWPTGANVTVALVDSGLDATHPAFAGRVSAAVRIDVSGAVARGGGDDEGHGTHVAGILAGSGAESQGERLRGFAPGARIVGVDISDSFTTASAVRAFAWIHDNRERHNIRVVSNSWGREKEDAHYDPDDPVVRASDALVSDGIVVVFSAGNRGRDGAGTLTTEAMNPNVLTVGSASAAGRVEPYSSRGPAVDAARRPLDWVKPDVMAPGSGIVSTRTSALADPEARGEGRYYVVMNGTSMAAPQAAGAAALLLDAHPELSPQMVIAILQGTARDLGRDGPDGETGYGMLDVGGALDAARVLSEGERSVVVESRVPVRLTGAVAAVAGQIVLSGNAPKLPPQGELRLPLTLPPGAARADLAFTWSGQGDFDVKLVGEGRELRFARADDRTLALEADAAAGRYEVVVTPRGAAANTPFAVDGEIVVQELRAVDVPAEFHARPFTAQGGFFIPEGSIGRAMAVLRQAPLLALALCGIVATVAGARWRRRSPPTGGA